MTDVPNGPWFGCLAPCEAHVPCGQGRHIVRWEAGALRPLSHPDPEAELVLAALGGEKARCVEVAQAWERHAEDLSVLAIGPRGPADEIALGWDDVDAAVQASGRPVPSRPVPSGPVPPGPPRAAPMRLASPSVPTSARVQAQRQRVEQEVARTTQRRNDMLSLLALGYGFQVRLIGQVAEAHANPPDDQVEKVRPPLVAAISARLAPVAEEWIGIDPDQVVVSLHRGPGWGSVELTGRGEQRRLLVRLWECLRFGFGIVLPQSISVYFFNSRLRSAPQRSSAVCTWQSHAVSFRFLPQTGQIPLQDSLHTLCIGKASTTCSRRTSSSSRPSPS